MIEFPGEDFRQKEREIIIGKNRFGEKGIRLALQVSGLNIKGKLNFGVLSPLKYDIMGPFSLVPFMECRHSVWSMKHWVWGKMCINGKEYDFDRADGYWEGDCGRSFPKQYVWTQCSFYAGALMLSVAEIPLAGFQFRGVIGVVLWRGKEYRLATYLGAKAVRIRHGLVKVVQGELELEAELLEKKGKALKAPTGGNMDRVIHESVACGARYRFRQGDALFWNLRQTERPLNMNTMYNS